MKYKLVIKGKKGGILGSTLSNFGAYVAFVFVVIIFFTFFQIQTLKVIENRITGLEREVGTNTILLNYLRTPVSNDIYGEEIPVNYKKNIADLIIESYLNNNYNEVDKITRRHLSDMSYDWILTITNKAGDKFRQIKSPSAWEFEKIGEGFIELRIPKGSEEFEIIYIILAIVPYRE